MSEPAVVASAERHRGKVITVRTDTIRLPDGTTVERDVVAHPGAVGVVALDDAGRVLLLRQYRHPVGTSLWELPAGLRDEPGEPPERTARRELLEETGWTARRWDLLAEAHSSPGMTDERVLVYLARELAPHDGERPELADEERDMELRWTDLDAACDEVAAGRITNALCVIGLLAAARARDADFRTLRPA